MSLHGLYVSARENLHIQYSVLTNYSCLATPKGYVKLIAWFVTTVRNIFVLFVSNSIIIKILTVKRAISSIWQNLWKMSPANFLACIYSFKKTRKISGNIKPRMLSEEILENC